MAAGLPLRVLRQSMAFVLIWIALTAKAGRALRRNIVRDQDQGHLLRYIDVSILPSCGPKGAVPA
jgi:hypothetical protein